MTHVVAYVALGSNLGDRDAHLAAARAGLAALADTRVVRASRIEQTDPVGPPDQGPYLNQMLCIETALSAEALLAGGHAIEARAGRRRDPAARWGPRTLDIDLVLFGTCVLATESVRVPHPELARRDFWQRHLADLGIDWRGALASAEAGAPPAAMGAGAAAVGS